MRKLTLKSILAYADTDDKRQLKQAVTLAEKLQARLKLVDVLEPGQLRGFMFSSVGLADLVRAARQKRLAELAARLSTPALKVRAELLEGQAHEALIREAVGRGHSLVMVNLAEGAARRTSSTGMRLLRKCPCPVWVAGLKPLKRKVRVLAAVDTVAEDEARASLNAKVLAAAQSVAQLCGGELHVLTAWHAYGEGMLRGPYFSKGIGASAGDAQVDRYVQETLLRHTGELTKMLKELRILLPKGRVHLLKGEAADVIAGFCETRKVDVLVLGTIARAGLGAALIGNTAETLVHRVECSILAVKPDGFASSIASEHAATA